MFLAHTLVVEHHGHLVEYAKSAKSNEAKSRKWPKTPFQTIFGPFWAQIEVRNLFSVNFVVLVVEHHGHLLVYAKSAKSNEAKSRKLPKTPFQTVFGPFWPKFEVQKFFSLNFVLLAVKHHGHLLEYTKSAKSNEAKSRKSPKTPFQTFLDCFWTVLSPNCSPKFF